MATMNFLRGSIKGKIGQLVGSSWRGKEYIKTFTPPSNPNTEGQAAVRTVFQHTAHIAKAIYEPVLKPYTFPKPHKLTAYNRVIQINKAMFHELTWNPKKLQILTGDLKPEKPDRVEWGAGTYDMEVYWTPDTTQQEGKDDIAIAIAHYEGNETTAYGLATRKDGLIEIDVSVFGPGFKGDEENVYVYLCFARPPNGTNKQGQNSGTSVFSFPSTKTAPAMPDTPAPSAATEPV
jgi:hypothetical protein